MEKRWSSGGVGGGGRGEAARRGGAAVDFWGNLWYNEGEEVLSHRLVL